MSKNKKNGWFFSRSILDEIKKMEENDLETPDTVTSNDETSNAKVEELKEALALARYKNEGLRSEKKNLERQIADQHKALSEKDAHDLTTTQAQVSEIEATYRAEEERLIHEIDRLKQLNVAQEHSLQESKEEIARQKSDQSRISQLEEELRVTNEKYQLFESQYRQNQEQWQKEMALTERKNLEVTDLLSNEKAAHEKELLMQQSNFNLLEQHLQDEIETLTELNDKQAAKLQEANKESTEITVEHQERLQQVNLSLENSQAALQELNQTLELKEEQWNEEKKRLIEKYEQRLTAEQHRLAEMTETLKNNKAILGGLQEKMSEIKEHSFSNEEVKELQAEIERLTLETEALASENRELKQNNTENSILENKLISLTDQILIAENNLKQAMEENQVKAAIQEENQALETTIAHLKSELTDKEEAFSHLEQELIQRAQIEPFNDRGQQLLIDELQAKIEELEQENKFLQGESGGIQSEISEILLFTRRQANRTLEEAQSEANKILRATEMQVAKLRSRANEIIFEVRDSKESILSHYQDVEKQVQELVDYSLKLTEDE